MKAKTLFNEKARLAVNARLRDKSYKLLGADFGEVGEGDPWDESIADQAAAELIDIKDKLTSMNKRIDVNSFDVEACVILHQRLGLPPNLVAHQGFWRWLAVEKFAETVEARSRTGVAHPRNYGIDASVTDNRIAILWFRADMVYDEGKIDPYHLARRPAHTDFWESGIIRPRYAWSKSLARALVRFQYRDASSETAHLHGTHKYGIRELYKRLRRLHTTISFEYLTEEDLMELLEEKSAGLQRA